MIVREEEKAIVLIGQPDHARICGVMARAWGREPFARVEPLEPVALAAAEHDNGWADWEAAPRLNPETGRPYTYSDIPIEPHLEIYRRGIARMVERDPYAGLLVSLHGTLLYSRFRSGQPGAGEFLDEQIATQYRLIDTLCADPALAKGCVPERLKTNRDLVFAWDTLSLIFCLDHAFVDRIEVPTDYAGARAEGTLRRAGRRWILDPYPFTKSPLVFRVPARRLVGMRFEDEPAFRRAFAEARPTVLEPEVAAPSAGG